MVEAPFLKENFKLKQSENYKGKDLIVWNTHSHSQLLVFLPFFVSNTYNIPHSTTI